jgi:hypothetical protein
LPSFEEKGEIFLDEGYSPLDPRSTWKSGLPAYLLMLPTGLKGVSDVFAANDGNFS